MSKCDMVLSRKVSSSSCRSSFKNSPGFPVPALETTRPMSRSSVAEASCPMKSSRLFRTSHPSRVPRGRTFFIERDCHLFAPFCLLGACCVCCVTNNSFELILCSEHTIDRSAHLLQNKSRRHATHHFELIRLTRTNFESIGLHSLDGDFNHVFHLHDRNAFHVFRIKATQEFGLCRRRC